MSLSDWIATFALLLTAAALAWAIGSYSIDKNHEKSKEIELLKKANSDQSIESITALLEEIRKRVFDWESIQKNQATATMQNFHAMELSIKDYQKNIEILSERYQQQSKEIERIWKTVVTEIAPGVFRISDKK